MMGTLVCQECEATIDYFDAEKVTVLYSTCHCCHEHNAKEEDK